MRRGLTCIMATLCSVAGVGAAPVTKHQQSNQIQPKPEIVSNQADLKQKARGTQQKAASKTKPAYQLGLSSWYGRQFHGRKTASGEAFDMFQFTAAHRHLPLGSWLKVTNLKNGKWVVVRVNDRGPVPQSRILDLSYGAAQMLKFGGAGVTRVRLDLMKESTAVAMAQDVAVRAALP